MGDIVVYHNDTNRVSLGDLKENESRLLFALFEKLKNNGLGTLSFTSQEVKLLIGVNYKFTDVELSKIVKGLWEKIKIANFWLILPRREENIMLFRKFAINYIDDEKTLVKSIEIGINEEFEFLLNNAIGNFTTFELEEYQSLSGKYTQTLYRLLKQYKGTGYARFEWSKFIEVMGVPKSYRMCDIEAQILKKALKELTRERTLSSGTKSIPFSNLEYIKTIKGRGGKVVGIEFTFDKQGDYIDTRTRSEKIEDLKAENRQLVLDRAEAMMQEQKAFKELEILKEATNRLQEQNYHIECKEYTDLRIDKADKFKKIQTSHIVKVIKRKNEADTTSKSRYYLMVEFLNIASNTKWTMEFKSVEHLCNYIRKQTLTEETSKHNFILANDRNITDSGFIAILFNLQEFLRNDPKVSAYA